MSLDFEIDVDDDEIAKRIERGIDWGIRNAAEKIALAGRKKAKERIQFNGRVWRRQLLNSFNISTGYGSGHYFAHLKNDADYAAAVDEGATYGDEGPPIAALIPWILTNWHPGSPGSETHGTSNSPKKAETRSKQFSDESSLDSKEEYTNTQKIADTEYTSLLKGYDQNRLSFSSSETLEEQLKDSELDTDVLDDVKQDIRSWKASSMPGVESTDKYAEASRRLFGVKNESRGNFDGDIEVEYAEALKTWSAIGRLHLQDQYGDEDGKMQVKRGLGKDTGFLAQQVFDNPSADSWKTDRNAIVNFTTDDSTAQGFDKGLIVEKDVSIDDDILYAHDFVMPHKGRREENEIHVRGDRAEYDLTELYLTSTEDVESGGFAIDSRRSFDEFLTEFIDGDFSGFSDSELESFKDIVNNMDLNLLSVSTPAGQSRMIALRDEIIQRGLFSREGMTESEITDLFDSVV